MHRICITFDGEIVDKLRTRAADKKISLAQYARELIGIGLRVEEMSAEKEGSGGGKNSEIEMAGDAKMLWKNNLNWSLESLYLVRCLVNDLLPKTNAEYLATAKQKAQAFVEGLLQEEP